MDVPLVLGAKKKKSNGQKLWACQQNVTVAISLTSILNSQGQGINGTTGHKMPG